LRYYGLRYLLLTAVFCSSLATINHIFVLRDADNTFIIGIASVVIGALGLKLLHKMNLEFTIGFIFTLFYNVIYYAGYTGLLDISITLLTLTMILFLSIFFINSKVMINLLFLICIICNTYLLHDSTLVVIIQYIAISIVFFMYLSFTRSLVMNTQRNIKNEKHSVETRSKEIELFSQIMTHDIKAPLRNIASICRLLRRDIAKGNINSTHHTMISHVVTSVKMAQELVDSLMEKYKQDFSENMVNKICLNKLIQQTVETLEYQINNTNTQLITDNLGEIIGDERALKTLFINLISNAIKYQPKDSSQQPLISISHSRSHTMHFINVRDNGIGIEESDVNNIFEPFKRLHNKSEYMGSGLGLFLCKSIVEKHRGTISATSIEGLGTNISICLPRFINDGHNGPLMKSHLTKAS